MYYTHYFIGIKHESKILAITESEMLICCLVYWYHTPLIKGATGITTHSTYEAVSTIK